MTDDERTALVALAQAWNALLRAVPDARSRAEAAATMHQLQNLILAQPTIRANPDLLRQAGG